MQLVKWNSLKDCTVFEGIHLTNPKGGIIPAGIIPAGMIPAGLEEFRAIEIESMCERIHANPWMYLWQHSFRPESFRPE